MSRHRLEPPAHLRPRYGRIGAVGLSVLVTLVALLGGIGVIPVGGHDRSAYAGTEQAAAPIAPETSPVTSPETGPVTTPASPQAAKSTETARNKQPERQGDQSRPRNPGASTGAPAGASALPADTGQGKRVVFSISDQRVWLVGRDGNARSYLVSGSLTDNLDPGSYHVYSRSRWAVGVEDSGVMEYFVRFTRGENAAIGFHSIPTKGGTPLQTVADLGTPQSHGCIRQKLADARQMWDFAPVGTDVVVVA